MKILHITNWYPTKSHPYDTPFIKEHFDALNLYSEGQLVHVEALYSDEHLLKFEHTKISSKEESFIIKSKLRTWLLKEIISTFLTLYVLYKKRYKTFDIAVFHVGYPNLTFFYLWKRFFKLPITIIEHWTAFHYNFSMPQETKKLDRIKQIYRQGIPLLTVSKRLKKDIEYFSDKKQKAYILPNVVDRGLFYFDVGVKRNEGTFFMVNYWREIKSPFPILHAFKKYVVSNPYVKLTIGGYGPLWSDILKFIEDYDLKENIIAVGRLTKEEVAHEMRKSEFFIHNADYETFSVVCAEAISCGCPVAVSKLDAVQEFINESNGVIINTPEEWHFFFKNYNTLHFDNLSMSNVALEKFSKENVGMQFKSYLEEIIIKCIV